MMIHRILEKYFVVEARVPTAEQLMGRLGPVRDVIRAIEAAGWVHHRTSGSHHIWKHPTLPGVVVIPYAKGGETIPKGTLKNILKAAGLAK